MDDERQMMLLFVRWRLCGNAALHIGGPDQTGARTCSPPDAANQTRYLTRSSYIHEFLLPSKTTNNEPLSIAQFMAAGRRRALLYGI